MTMSLRRHDKSIMNNTVRRTIGLELTQPAQSHVITNNPTYPLCWAAVQHYIQRISEVTNNCVQETQLSLTNRATRLEVNQGHQTWEHLIC